MKLKTKNQTTAVNLYECTNINFFVLVNVLFTWDAATEEAG